jgi:uncharacterized membrane protein
MNLHQSAEIHADITSVWTTLIDVERWPEWTATMEKVEQLDRGPFGIGSRARVQQPRIPVAIWTVTEFEPGKAFAWGSRAFGIHSVATHRLEPRDDGTVALTLGFAQTGWLARLVRSKAEKIAREYLAIEAQGLKRRCEG